jgi:hypothetical protein
MITKEQLKDEIDSLEDTQILERVYQLIQSIKQSPRAVAVKTLGKHNKAQWMNFLECTKNWVLIQLKKRCV